MKAFRSDSVSINFTATSMSLRHRARLTTPKAPLPTTWNKLNIFAIYITYIFTSRQLSHGTQTDNTLLVCSISAQKFLQKKTDTEPQIHRTWLSPLYLGLCQLSFLQLEYSVKYFNKQWRIWKITEVSKYWVKSNTAGYTRSGSWLRSIFNT